MKAEKTRMLIMQVADINTCECDRCKGVKAELIELERLAEIGTATEKAYAGEFTLSYQCVEIASIEELLDIKNWWK